MNYKDPLSVENGLIDLYKHQIMKNTYDAKGINHSRRLIFHCNETIDDRDYTVVIKSTYDNMIGSFIMQAGVELLTLLNQC